MKTALQPNDTFNTIRMSAVDEAAKRMREAGQPEPVINNFKRLHEQVISGQTGIIHEKDIAPVGEIAILEQLRKDDLYLRTGMQHLDQVAIVRLNGGLGSSMGMPNAKSLLAVRGALTFNDLMISQLSRLNEDTGHDIPLIHMTSFRTDYDIQAVMNSANYANPGGLPYTFTQHKHPKLYLDDLSVAKEANEEHNWNPPGHGDIYASLLATGIAQKLISAGKRYVFVANSDNLGATVAPEILGYMIHHRCDFLMETCERTSSDRKGGHLARRVDNGRLLLREVAQAPTDDKGEVIPEFQDISKYNQFNTNSIWLDLNKVIQIAELHNGCIPLPLIRNVKPVNTEDRTSRKAIQIETAMGAAIEVFTNAQAIQVSRDRFMPVKTTNDLLLVMSDRYEVSPSGHLVLKGQLKTAQAPSINLEQTFFGMIADFQERVLVCPSLREASSLKVTGDWLFDAPVNIVGDVHLNGIIGVQHRVSLLGLTDLSGEIASL